MNVREAYMRASSFLREKGLDDHAASAELLLQHVLGVDRTRLLMLWSDPIEDAAFERLWPLVQRRAAGEPVQYIMGETYFYGLPFQVSKEVLIPRPETELLVERIVRLGREMWGGAPVIAADVGTGSGAIAVSLAAEQPNWRLLATDISPQALAVAHANAERNEVGHRLEFLEGDLLEPAAARMAETGEEMDILVSNPPYIPTGDIGGLQIEVREYEPYLALDGGLDGLEPYRRMFDQMNAFGTWPRIVGFETGLGLARELAGLFQTAGRWEEVEIVRDLAGIERHVIAWRREKHKVK